MLGVMFTDNGQNMTSLQGHSRTETGAPSLIKGSQGYRPSDSHSPKIYVSDLATEELPSSQPVLTNGDHFLGINMAVGVGETLVVPVRVHKVEGFATIDSAAQVSIINTIPAIRIVGVKITLGRNEFPWDVFLADTANTILLGLDLLRGNQCVLKSLSVGCVASLNNLNATNLYGAFY